MTQQYGCLQPSSGPQAHGALKPMVPPPKDSTQKAADTGTAKQSRLARWHVRFKISGQDSQDRLDAARITFVLLSVVATH